MEALCTSSTRRKVARSLVIVESPGKIRTIKRYLGKDYDVKSSVGHVRDLPTSGQAERTPPARGKSSEKKALTPKQREAQRRRQKRHTLVRRMGVDPDHGWQASYEILPSKQSVVKELRTAASKADQIYLATDLDREGEAIAWHLQEVIGGDEDRFARVVFSEITKNAIEKAFENPGKVDYQRVHAQQARRFLDRVVGFEITPLLYSKIARGLSAGRVQSVAVKLVVEREREIRAFKPEEYWDCFADLRKDDSESTVHFQVVRASGREFRPHNEDEATQARARLEEAEFKVLTHEAKETSTSPNPPFITTTLQRAASTQLNFSVSRTMRLAQILYERGLITYMRTDSTNLSTEAVNSVRNHIGQTFGPKYLPDTARVYQSKESAQEAHEAIRPTEVTKIDEPMPGLDADAQRLYSLILRRFIACQMTPARYENTTVTVKAGEYELRVTGRVMLFDGYTRVLRPASRNNDVPDLPKYAVGETLHCDNIEISQHFTRPPARFSEARLIRELERLGIGRPSTYASIISTIQDRGYVTLRNKRFYAERIGELVTDRLSKNFDNLLSYSFTADLEEQLDQIALGKLEWKSVLDTFYTDFSERLKTAEDAEHGMSPNVPLPTSIKCPNCGRNMNVRIGSTGMFLGCEGYSLPPKERCRQTINLIPDEEAVSEGVDPEEAETLALLGKRQCEACGTAMDGYIVNETTKLHICGQVPDCPGLFQESGSFRIKGYEGPIVECDKCGHDMQLRTGRFGKYFGCTNESCKNTRKLLRNGEVAPPRADPVPMPELECPGLDDYFVLRDGAAGIFLAASKYPRNRLTRAPTITEIANHANEIDPKFQFLLTAPPTDPKGNDAFVRYSRKNKEQYVASQKAGKDTGWRAYYRDGKWVTEESKKRPAKRRSTKGTTKRRSS